MPAKRKSAFSAALREAQQHSEELSEVQKSTSEDAKHATSPDMQNLGSLELQTSRLPDVQRSTSADVEEFKPSKVQRSKHPEWKQKTIYLPPALAHWLNVHAAQAELEISEIVALALQEYRDRHF